MKLANAYDLSINATGGGSSGQAGAVRLAISRALLQVDNNLRATLKAEGLLRRDPRMKERKNQGSREPVNASTSPSANRKSGFSNASPARPRRSSKTAIENRRHFFEK